MPNTFKPNASGATNDFGWTSISITGTWNTNVTYTGFYKRVADTMFVAVIVSCSGAPNNTSLSITIPGALTIDTAKLPSTNVLQNVLGSVMVSDSDTTAYFGFPRYSSTTAVNLVYGNVSANLSNFSATAPFTFGAGDYVGAVFAVPISGWS